MGWVNFVRQNRERRTIPDAFHPSCGTTLISQDSSSTRPVDILDWLSFVFVGFEHLNLEGVIRPFVEVDERATWGQIRGYSCLFLNK